MDKIQLSAFEETFSDVEKERLIEWRENLNKTETCERHVPVSKPGVLYTITTIAALERYGGERTPVICTSMERAVEIVETNEGDIWECSYQLVVIEEVIPDALYGSCGALFDARRYWYRWNLEEGRYESVKTPPQFENTFGFGIG